MENEKTRITIRIDKDLLAEFKKIFPYRGEMTAFILRCMEGIVKNNSANLLYVIKNNIIGGR